MKIYKKCEPCKSDGLILCGEELQPCENCNGVGYIETEIPVELQKLSIEAHDYAVYRVEHSGIDCGFCGASLEKPDNILKDNVYVAGGEK